MPILKQLVQSNQSKRRSRADLTAEMISAPLGDFRHTMHVGRGGDAFGDTSFLSTRSGEGPDGDAKQGSPGPKAGLLARTFRGSRRSQSVNRGDKYEYGNVAPANFVKNAISLPYLNEEGGRGGVASNPMKKLVEVEVKPANGAAAAIATFDAELDERNFGDLGELPPSVPKGGALKHAESMMSFHIDLGPSMLGDILSVMEKKDHEDVDLGFEEGKGSEGSPSHIPLIDDDVAEEQQRPPARPPRLMYPAEAPYTPELHARDAHLDSCSVSSAGSVSEDKTAYHPSNHLQHYADTDSAKHSSPRGDEDFSFMDDEDDEIRV
ncbi:cdc42 effector protein 4-like [Entelurus aequoreus]|uniref:cdc42 effector protein 4-like n=1 Tax=Entelurus aequoreus TaxID=161455 RepID=UPI002B1D15CE|nr:cdc42 effector protein 4-like [Entelurus aequoreus]XP_061913320.1 cdc42 effector protein 4-like [Entelurus aequoreus]XP_061913321.1 cdc42 effector protein 4-like [Entelurus aequoreus]